MRMLAGNLPAVLAFQLFGAITDYLLFEIPPEDRNTDTLYGDGVDVNFPANIVTAAVENGMVVRLGGIAILILHKDGIENATQNAPLVFMYKQDPGQEGRHVVDYRDSSAETLLNKKCCCLLGVYGVREVERYYDSPMQWTPPTAYNLQPIATSTFGWQISLTLAETTVSLDVALGWATVGMPPAAQQRSGKEAVIAACRLKQVMHQADPGVGDMTAGCHGLSRRVGPHGATAMCRSGRMMEDESPCNCDVAPRFRDSTGRFLHPEDCRSAESIAEKEDPAAIAAVKLKVCERTISVADRLRRSDHTDDCEQPEDCVVGTAVLACRAEMQNERISRAAPLRRPSDTRSAPLPHLICVARLYAHGASDAVTTVLRGWSTAQFTSIASCPQWSRRASLPTFATRFPARDTLISPGHPEALAPRAHALATVNVATRDIRFPHVNCSIVGVTKSAPLTVAHVGAVRANRDCAVTSAHPGVVAGFPCLEDEVTGFTIIKVDAAAALNLRRSDHRTGTCMVTIRVGYAADAAPVGSPDIAVSCFTDTKHAPLPKLSRATEPRSTRYGDSTLSGITRLAGPRSAARMGHVMSRRVALSRPMPQLSVAAHTHHNAETLSHTAHPAAPAGRHELPVRDAYFAGDTAVSGGSPGDGNDMATPKPTVAATGRHYIANFAPHPALPSLTQQGRFSVDFSLGRVAGGLLPTDEYRLDTRAVVTPTSDTTWGDPVRGQARTADLCARKDETLNTGPSPIATASAAAVVPLPGMSPTVERTILVLAVVVSAIVVPLVAPADHAQLLDAHGRNLALLLTLAVLVCTTPLLDLRTKLRGIWSVTKRSILTNIWVLDGVQLWIDVCRVHAVPCLQERVGACCKCPTKVTVNYVLCFTVSRLSYKFCSTERYWHRARP
jgi:hypothetical protein